MKSQAFNQKFKYECVAKLIVHIDLFIDDAKVLESSPNITGIYCKEEKVSVFLSENWIIIDNILTLV